MLDGLKWLYHLVVAIASALWFRFPGRELTVIGVTGTDGKTTTTTLIYEILKASGAKVSMVTSVHAVIAGKVYDTGFHVTTPTAFFVQKYLREAADHGDEYMVLEVTSHGLAQHRVLGIPFAVGVLTNITHEHLDWHRSFEDYRDIKLSLLTRAARAVANKDDGLIYAQIRKIVQEDKLTTYGLRSKADITPATHPIHTRLPGTFNLYNCLAAVATASSVGINTKISQQAIAKFAGVSGRMEVVTVRPYTVIVDFAHTPNAITQALSAVRTTTKKRVIHIFGSAGLRDRTKRPMMGKASAQFADIIILTEEDYRIEDVNDIINQIAGGIPASKKVYKVADRKEAIRLGLSLARPGDTVIITGKGHEKSLCRGSVEYPWSDQQAVRDILKQTKKGIRYAQKNK